MPANLLSATTCKNATCKGANIRKLHDGEGLYLWVYTDGKKYWRLRYWQNNKEKSLSLGVFPHVSLQNAREKRAELRRQLHGGLDPSIERKTAKRREELASAHSFEAVALEWHQKRVNAWSVRHAFNVKRRLDVDLIPALGSRPIAEIDALELLGVVRAVETRGAHDLAHRVLQIAGQVFLYGISTGRCKTNLAAGLSVALTRPSRKRQNAVKREELPALLSAIARYDELGDLQTQLALQMLVLTFVRTGELIDSKWREFDLENAIWTIPAERMKNNAEHVVPLSKQALLVLAQLKAISGKSALVLPGRNILKPISNNTMLFALYRLGYKDKMTGHGFRSIASTILNESGFNADAIERQLSHCEKDPIRRAYNNAVHLQERKTMMQWWADQLDSLRAQNSDGPQENVQ